MKISSVHLFHFSNFVYFLLQAKQLCLAIARTMILERRPVSVVGRALDVLLTSYSQSIKTGSYHKKTKAEKASTSGVSNASSPNIVVDDANNQADAFRKSVKHETQSSGIENESSNRSFLLTSDSEDNLSVETQKVDSLRLDSSSGKMDGDHSVSAGASSAAVRQTSAQSQISGRSDTPLNANTSENQDSQVTSAVISPDDLYSFVFAPVEEEMAGDASYLVAIIVEFLRRYFFCKTAYLNR